MKQALFIFMVFFQSVSHAENTPSTCYGSTKDGHLGNGWQLPSSGKNFDSYSSVGAMLGRNYVHSKIYSVVLAAYKELETSAPDTIFVYGESGFKNGGPIKPHKTHRNGLSVDFFVPVINTKGVSVKLPTSPLNKFGYSIEFDENAKFDNYRIDFDAIAKHLLAIHNAAKTHNVGISVVIFENSFQNKLFSTTIGRTLPDIIKFSVKKPWVRHDEHYHIDFDIECKQLTHK